MNKIYRKFYFAYCRFVVYPIVKTNGMVAVHIEQAEGAFLNIHMLIYLECKIVYFALHGYVLATKL